MNETNTIILSFFTNLNDTISITVPRANKNISSADVKTYMQQIIDGGIVISTNGYPTSIKDAVMVTKELEVMNLM